MQEIAFPDANDIVFNATLDGTKYKLRMLWNSSGGYWALSIRSESGTSILEGIKVVPNYPLLCQYHRPTVPPGELMVITQDDKLVGIGRNDLAESKVVLVYVTEDEVNAI